MQGIVGVRVGRKPERSIDVFPIGFKVRENVFVVFLDDVGNRLPVTLNDLHVLVVDPDSSLEITLILFHFLGGDVENVGVQFIDNLAPDVADVVLGQLFGGQHERLNIFQVVE